MESAGFGARGEKFLPAGFQTLLDAVPDVVHCVESIGFL